ncbi:MAG: response regulator [Sterolibacteriaceae bacterium]|nr:response regulator [Sterolibacteriaceae bacterium]
MAPRIPATRKALPLSRQVPKGSPRAARQAAYLGAHALRRMGVRQTKQAALGAAMRDIGKHKLAEKHLQEQQVRLEQLVRERTVELTSALEAAQIADKAKDAFVANVSHELRTPLGAVIGLSALALGRCENPAQRDYLEKIGKAGKHLSRIINDLLDLSKIVAGRMEIETIPFSLRSMIRHAEGLMANKAESKELLLEFSIDDDVPDRVAGDPLRIEQILLNLIGNAIKFTPTGRVDVRVSTQTRAADSIRLVMSVADTGVGIRPADIGGLFQPFAQTDVSMTRKFGGTGLGLALSQHLAEMMDGRIDVDSREGVGSTFCLAIRLGLGVDSDPPEDEPGQAISPPDLHVAQASVLVVEDDAMNMEIAVELLQAVGIAPRTACNGQEAVEILGESDAGRFDLVLMDIQMPVLDGLSATRLIRTWPGFDRLPIVAMTAHVLAHEKRISTDAGMNDHVCKPFDANDFYRMLAKWLPERRTAATPAPAEPAPAPTPVRPTLPAIRGVDTAAALTRFFGDEQRYRYWLTKFVEESPSVAPEIRRAMAAGQTELASRMAHSFKSRAGTLGLNELQLRASALETALNAPPAGVPELRGLERAIDEARREIATALGL